MENTNISKVYLLSVPLESDYKHTLYFNSKESQHEYFASKVVKSYTDFSYQRKDNVIRVPEHFDNIYNANYVMYQNTKYGSKWFYAFVKDMKYVSDGRTDLTIETDVIQTWLFDYTLKPSFVEREHVTNDTAGVHILDEGLDTGEYICNSKVIDEQGNDLFIYMAVSDYAGKVIGDVKGNLVNGIYSGMEYHVYNTTTEAITELNNEITSYDEASKADAINSIFMAPAWLSGIPPVGENGEFKSAILGKTNVPKTYNTTFAKQTTLNNYEPRNKKLLCYPYNYVLATNNAGSSAIYKYERFSGSNCTFKVNGTVTPGGSIRMNPTNYNGVDVNNEEGLNAGKYPICCWNSDTYTNWLTQNSVNNALGVASGALQIGAGLAMALGTGGLGMAIGGGTVVGGVSTIANVMAGKHQASLVPDQARGNTNCGDVITGAGENTFMFYKMSIKHEIARILDGYFDMFGYKVNCVKIPSKAHRSRYWYTKTIDVNIDGNLPQADLQKIKDAYNQGITFWRNASEIQDYSLSNGIAIID